VGPESSLPCSQEHAICPCPLSGELSPHHFIPFNIISPLVSVFIQSHFLASPTKTPCMFLFSPICAIHPEHLILLGLVIWKKLGEEYKLQSFLLWNFLQSFEAYLPCLVLVCEFYSKHCSGSLCGFWAIVRVIFFECLTFWHRSFTFKF